MNGRRSKFDVFLDIVIVLYEYNNIKMDVLIRKANLCTGYQKEIIDLLVVNGLVSVTNDNFLYLSSVGEEVVGEIVPGIKKAVNIYNKVNNNE